MSKKTVTLVTCTVVVLFAMLGPAPVNSLFADECFDCYGFELPLPGGGTQTCSACLSLPDSSAMGCYQIGACGCATLFPGQCGRC